MPRASSSWTAAEAPGALGYWPAQAVATNSLSGHPVMDTMVAVTLADLHQGGQWNEELLTRWAWKWPRCRTWRFTGHAAGTMKLPARGGRSAGEAVVAGGSIDAMCDQIVAGAEQVGDVLVIFGATLIVWAVIQDWVEVPGLWTVPHTVPDRMLIGGPSNAGALFVDWARTVLRPGRGGDGRCGASGDPSRVPVWLPYLRGERVPYHDPSLRAGLYDLDICDTPEGLGRAAYEASGFVVRNFCERAGITPRRIVASGGGTRSEPWMAAVADASGLPIDCVAVPEGAALGAAYLARMAAGLEADLDGATTVGVCRSTGGTGSDVASGLRPALSALRRSRLRPLNPSQDTGSKATFTAPLCCWSASTRNASCHRSSE